MSHITGTPHEIKDFNTLLSEIKRQASIEAVVDKLGGLNLTQQGNDLVGNCPSGHKSESGTCFSVHLQDNFFKCFHAGCSAKGDVVELVTLVQGLKFRQSVLWLAEQFGIVHSVRHNGIETEISDEQRKIRFDLEIRSKLYQHLVDIGRRTLHEPAGADALNYLTVERKYDPSLLLNTEFFYLPPTSECRDILRQAFPHLTEEITALHMNGRFGDNFRLAMPYRNRHGQITGLLKRATEPKGITVTTHDGKHHDNVRWDSTKGLSKDDLFGLHAIDPKEPVVVVEGYPDAMYFPALGFTNVVAVGQGLLGKKHLEGLKVHGVKTLILALDNDPPNQVTGIRPGLENTRKTVELLVKETNLSVFVIDPEKYGQHKDPDEFVRVNGVDAFRTLVDAAESTGKWMIRHIIGSKPIESDQKRHEALESALAFIAQLKSDLERENAVELLSKALGVGKTALQKSLSEKIREQIKKSRKNDADFTELASLDLFPFIETGTSRYAYYNRPKESLHLNVPLELMEQIFVDSGQSLPEQLPVLQLVFDVHSNEQIDLSRKRFNLFKPTDYMLLPKTTITVDLATSCPKILLLMENLIPDTNERERYFNWLAGIIQTRDKQGTAWIFQGKPGAGKGVHLNYVLKPLFGKEQVYQVENQELASAFNGWLRNVMIIAFNEVAHDNESRNGIKSKIKSIITDSDVIINDKFVPAYRVQNFANCLFFSNENVPLVIEAADRRFNVVKTGDNLMNLPWFNADPAGFIAGIESEISAFAQFLTNYAYDANLARTPISNSAKTRMVAAAMNRFEEFAMRLRAGDVEWLEEAQENAGNSFGVHTTTPAASDLAKKMVLKDVALKMFNNIHPNQQVNMVTLAKQLGAYGFEPYRSPGGVTSVRQNYFKWS